MKRSHPYDLALQGALPWVLLGSVLMLASCAVDKPGDVSHPIDAQAAEELGGASRIPAGGTASAILVRLTRAGQGVRFDHVPAGSTLAIRYASVSVGTIGVAVNDQPARKLNVHSSGDLTTSFLIAKTDLAIPAGASVTVSVADNDVPVTIERIIVGDGELGLPPDIWNLPALPHAAASFASSTTRVG